MVAAERHSVDERVKKIIELKNKVSFWDSSFTNIVNNAFL